MPAGPVPASAAMLVSTRSYLMNKTSRKNEHENLEEQFNFKGCVAKWKKTKPRIRLMGKPNPRQHSYSSGHHRTSPFFSPEFFRSLLLSFSPALDEHNPDISEWREDIGRVVRTALSQGTARPPSPRRSVPEPQWLSGSLLFHTCLAVLIQQTWCFKGPCEKFVLFYGLPVTTVSRPVLIPIGAEVEMLAVGQSRRQQPKLVTLG